MPGVENGLGTLFDIPVVVERAKCSSAVSPFRMAWSAVRHQGGLSATVIACQRGLFSGIDNQIEVGKQNFLIGMGIAKVFNNDTHKLLCLG